MHEPHHHVWRVLASAQEGNLCVDFPCSRQMTKLTNSSRPFQLCLGAVTVLIAERHFNEIYETHVCEIVLKMMESNVMFVGT